MKDQKPQFAFRAERGEFKWINKNRLLGGEILASRGSTAFLITPSPRTWRTSVSLVQGASIGTGVVVLGTLSSFLRSGGSPFALFVGALVAVAFLTMAALAIDRARCRWLARRPGTPPVKVTVKEVTYHLYYQRLLISNETTDFWMTVAARRKTLQKALRLKAAS